MRVSSNLLTKCPCVLLGAVKGLLFVCLAYSTHVHAVGLGHIATNGVLGETYVAEVPISGADDISVSALKVNQIDHRRAAKLGAEVSGAWMPFEFEVKNRGRQKVIEIRSMRRVNEPLVDLFVQVIWPGGKAHRQYPLMFDLP